MSMQNRKSFISSSTTSSTLAAKRHAVSSEIAGGKATAVRPPNLSKKRPPLTNLTNQRQGSVGSTPSLVPCAAAKIVKAKKGSSANISLSRSTVPASLVTKPDAVIVSKTSFPKCDETISHATMLPAPGSMDISPTASDEFSVSMDESMSTCDSLKSPEVEYVDENDVAALHSIERKTSSTLHISEPGGTAGNVCKRDILVEIDMVDKVANVDNNFLDPQFCATFACDIYKHLRESELKKRPSTNFMEKIQKDINASMRAILIDWLVEVAEEYRLVPDTLYLTVNYIDRYLSGNSVNRQRLQLLGVACMMIAAKYEEICAPQVEEFCYITDNTYFKQEVLQMESTVLNFLKFEMTAPTVKCFLRRFVRAAEAINEVPPLQLECMSNYIAELSLIEYNMLRYMPSLVAASAIFLAQYILMPSKRPWNSTLQHYTLYEPSDFCDCVQALHQLCLNSHHSCLPAIREKYSQHKYKFVAKKYCPPSIPAEYFRTQRN
ncbi:hypothetical protein Nepgr_024159 [Nepenthes gracilis]|uniref:B-like cyclin n=1 Tax=Nepenthes gracilis TaxID=150966 RepID=A0AAD3T461_NEPGR|nr:hypothetical protein Nepgr_024159 [Nepenthes gracilis]